MALYENSNFIEPGIQQKELLYIDRTKFTLLISKSGFERSIPHQRLKFML